jgi:hypothetical protein
VDEIRKCKDYFLYPSIQVLYAWKSKVEALSVGMSKINFTPRWRTQALHRMVACPKQKRSHGIYGDMEP